MIKAKFLNGVLGAFSVAGLFVAAIVVPQQARAAQSDDYDHRYYFAAGLTLTAVAPFAASVPEALKDRPLMYAPVGGDKAIKLMEGYNEGYIEVKAKLNAERIRQLEQHILSRKPDMITLDGENVQFSTKIKYDKFERPINMKEVRATLKRAQAAKTPIRRVRFTPRGNSWESSFFYQAPSAPKNPKRIKTIKRLSRGTSLLPVIPFGAWIIDARTQAAGIPQSRKGYVADKFEKVLDTVVGKFSSKSSGKAGAEAAN